MKNARIWFSKDNTARFISHLDLNRCVLRAIQQSKLPIWYTEGFNPHPFVTFALPLSLGFRGLRESMDVKLISDINDEEFINKLNTNLPFGIKIFAITEPIMKPNKIAYADYNIKLFSDDINSSELFNIINKMLNMDEIFVDKKSKSGIKQVDLKENLCKYNVILSSNYVDLNLTLPAGSTSNVNPTLFVNALEKFNNIEIYSDITRLGIYNEDVKLFE